MEPLTEGKKSQEVTRAIKPAVEIADPTIRAIAARVTAKIEANDIAGDAQKKAAQIHKAVAKHPEQLWFPAAPMPTDMCRVSPFFPIARQELGARPFIEDMVISSGAWGSLKYSGPRLSTYDEDVLLAVLALLDQEKNRSITDEEHGRTTYKYHGTLRPIVLLSGHKSDSKGNYDRIVSSLTRMHSAAFRLSINRRDTRGKRKAVQWSLSNILIFAESTEGGDIEIVVNPYFYEAYVANSVTLIDVQRRAVLKSPISKALYRFVMSHRDDEWRGHFLTLAQALNLSTDIPVRKLKERLKSAIKDLTIRKILIGEERGADGKIIEGGSRFISDDIVRLLRDPRLLRRRKQIKK